jgi:hypothetical protein
MGTALDVMDNSETPRPTKSGTDKGLLAISPQMDTGMPVFRAALTVISIKRSTAG